MQRFVCLTILFLFFTTACQKGGAPTADNPQSSTDYYNRGVERQNKGDLDGAVADYTKAIELDPKNVSAYNNRGNIKEDKGNIIGAATDYTFAVATNQRHPTALYNLAHSFQVRKDYEGAIAAYSKAIEVKPDYAMAYANRGLCHLYEGRDAEAQKDFDRSLEINAGLKNSLEGYIADVKQQRGQGR